MKRRDNSITRKGPLGLPNLGGLASSSTNPSKRRRTFPHRTVFKNNLSSVFLVFMAMATTSFTNISPVVGETVFPSVSDLYPGSSDHASYDLQLPVQVTMAVLEPIGRWSFSLPKLLPVMDFAVAEMNEKYRGRIEFDYAWGLGSCERDVVGVEAARLSCSHNISVFIGPACSKAVEIVSYMANNWNVPVITPIGNTENIGDKTIFPRLTRINPWMQSALATTVFRLLDMYEWTNVGMESKTVNSIRL
ncbi:guanylate cyclase [Elysia marginata]|uniref:Guanylate cyclase n=1 Tax=Elysia marginata TaxID=1093978 RepID=A0AAV4I721_9GAST|nr:guanylate cyclase [Elysia marginata]